MISPMRLVSCRFYAHTSKPENRPLESTTGTSPTIAIADSFKEKRKHWPGVPSHGPSLGYAVHSSSQTLIKLCHAPLNQFKERLMTSCVKVFLDAQPEQWKEWLGHQPCDS